MHNCLFRIGRVGLIVLLFSLHLICLQPAFGCSCGGPAPACAYVDHAAAVFVGRVAFTDHDDSIGFRQRTLVRFEVEESFRGLPTGTRDVWIDPGSFTSCYQVYHPGERWLIFAYAGPTLPMDTPAVTVSTGESRNKPIPPGIDPASPPIIYSAPECSGSWWIVPQTEEPVSREIEYLRRYRDGTATSSVIGHITINVPFESCELLCGAREATVTLTGNGREFSTRTNPRGYYSFTDVSPGKYSVAAVLPYYNGPPPEEVEVAEGSCGYADLWLRGTGAIDGVVLDANGHPLKGVRVNISPVGKPWGFQRTETDRNGRYQFGELSEGNYEVGVNTMDSPGKECPYPKTEMGDSPIYLNPGERRQVPPIKLTPPLHFRSVIVDVRWPNGEPAGGVNVSVETERSTIDNKTTNDHGMVRITLADGLTYKLKAVHVIRRDGRFVESAAGLTFVIPTRGNSRVQLQLHEKTTKDQGAS